MLGVWEGEKQVLPFVASERSELREDGTGREVREDGSSPHPYIDARAKQRRCWPAI